MNRMFLALGGAAAVLIVAVLALGLYSNQPGIGGQPSPTPSPRPSPSVAVAPSPTPQSDPEGGRLEAGTYIFHPLGPPDQSMTFTMTLPAGWELWGPEPGENFLGLFSPVSYDPPDGSALGVLRVHSLNGDPCQWLGGADDIEVGPTVDDLATALTEQTAYEASDPVDVTVGGYDGKRVDLTLPDFESNPDDPMQAIGCDETSYLIWNADGFNIHAQGPSNQWHVWIVDVEGSRVVILAHDFPGTSEATRAQYEAIVDSIQIQP